MLILTNHKVSLSGQQKHTHQQKRENFLIHSYVRGHQITLLRSCVYWHSATTTKDVSLLYLLYFYQHFYSAMLTLKYLHLKCLINIVSVCLPTFPPKYLKIISGLCRTHLFKKNHFFTVTIVIEGVFFGGLAWSAACKSDYMEICLHGLSHFTSTQQGCLRG